MYARWTVSKRRVPSPATVLSLLALVVALGGSAYAISKVTGKNVQNKSLTGKDVKPDSLTGKQIAESKLGTVPSAAAATTSTSAAFADSSGRAGSAAAADALVGHRIVAVDASVAIPDQEVILALAGLELELECTPGLGGFLSATTTSDDAQITRTFVRSGGTDTVELDADEDFDTGEVVNQGIGEGALQYFYRAADGRVVTASLAYEAGSGPCTAVGYALAEDPGP